MLTNICEHINESKVFRPDSDQVLQSLKFSFHGNELENAMSWNVW